MASVSGKWRFNETLYAYSRGTVEVGFTSNGQSYNQIHPTSTSGNVKTMYYADILRTPPVILNVYDYNAHAYVANDDFRLIDFGDNSQTVSVQFYNWLTLNAKQVANGVYYTKVNGVYTNIYNGRRIKFVKKNGLYYQVIDDVSYNIESSVINGYIAGRRYILQDETLVVTLTPDSGYGLPAGININGDIGDYGTTGATWTYDSATGEITLSDATDNLEITAECVWGN